MLASRWGLDHSLRDMCTACYMYCLLCVLPITCCAAGLASVSPLILPHREFNFVKPDKRLLLYVAKVVMGYLCMNCVVQTCVVC